MAYRRKNGAVKQYIMPIILTVVGLFVYNKWVHPMTNK